MCVSLSLLVLFFPSICPFLLLQHLRAFPLAVLKFISLCVRLQTNRKLYSLFKRKIRFTKKSDLLFENADYQEN